MCKMYNKKIELVIKQIRGGWKDQEEEEEVKVEEESQARSQKVKKQDTHTNQRLSRPLNGLKQLAKYFLSLFKFPATAITKTRFYKSKLFALCLSLSLFLLLTSSPSFSFFLLKTKLECTINNNHDRLDIEFNQNWKVVFFFGGAC